jgi:hypothetical protein
MLRLVILRSETTKGLLFPIRYVGYAGIRAGENLITDYPDDPDVCCERRAVRA